jgi:hypothetical protein
MNKSILDAKLSHLSAKANVFAADLRRWVRNSVNRVTGADRRALAKRFATWIDQGQEPSPAPEPNPDKAELRLWLDELDQQGREALTEQLCDFCEAFEIELAWLVDGELAQSPELEASLGKMVLRYCLACKAAVDCDAELQKFRHRRVWKHKIKGAAHAGRADASESPR